MSEKKSWDVQRKAKIEPVVESLKQRTPARDSKELRRAAPRQAAKVNTKPAPRAAARPVRQVPPGTLKQRRKKQRTTARYLTLFFLVVLLGALMYVIWLPTFRIQAVTAQGPNADVVKQIAELNLTGTYFYIVPRNSVFFFPKSNIRAAILDASPEVSAVSIIRTSFSSLDLETTARATAFVWCGESISTPHSSDSCFDADVEGYVFEEDFSSVADDDSVASTSATQAKQQGHMTVYSLLDRGVSDGTSPIRAHILSYALIPDALAFVQAIRGLQVPVTSLAIRGDEADLWIGTKTRITYVLGHEKDAALLAASALPNLSLTNGSVEYVDLRFSGKAYIKKYGE